MLLAPAQRAAAAPAMEGSNETAGIRVAQRGGYFVHTESGAGQQLLAVRNRGYWFYVDDRDIPSKRSFAMVQILLSLTDTGDTARGPVVPLPN